MDTADERWLQAMFVIQDGKIIPIRDKADTIEEDCKDFELRIRSLEKYQSEQVGLTRGQATTWGLAIGAVSVIISTLIQFFIGGLLP